MSGCNILTNGYQIAKLKLGTVKVKLRIAVTTCGKEQGISPWGEAQPICPLSQSGRNILNCNPNVNKKTTKYKIIAEMGREIRIVFK